ncbi:hypothetical protein PR048_001957 [Dryococelus australis]|uniref:Uncharacterized protein n=1 Tax=Dryococelus australis TaxID=614101 RepID=A0ABQ9IIU0_9NEOP|nr:hypothetical protein PR048_001957 [Dryococelus australis]
MDELMTSPPQRPFPFLGSQFTLSTFVSLVNRGKLCGIMMNWLISLVTWNAKKAQLPQSLSLGINQLLHGRKNNVMLEAPLQAAPVSAPPGLPHSDK